MKNICKYCDKEIEYENGRQFGAHLTNCSENPSKKERDLKQKQKREFILECSKCGENYSVEITDHNFNTGRYKRFCSRSCANSKEHSDETKSKISKSLRKIENIVDENNRRKRENILKKCENCQKSYETKKQSQKYCSRSCQGQSINTTEKCRKGGLKSVYSQNRRSRNEIAFAELCQKEFKKVLLNEPIFNGWDADIIIVDLKVAILWNGIWHYKKITEKHSLLQVQNRDKIKIGEIKKSGYTPYIIKDIGKYSIDKVNSEWDIFNDWLFSTIH